MTIIVDLSPEVETRLRAAIASHDTAATRQLLVEAVSPTVEALLEKPADGLEAPEMDVLLDQVTEAAGEALPFLSDYAVSREGIYEDHP